MKIFNRFNISKNYHNSIILIGNFDGVHLGHQKLFKRAREYKKKFRCKIGVITFNPMPKMFFNKSLKHFTLMNLSQKVNQFKKQRVDFLINQKKRVRQKSGQKQRQTQKKFIDWTSTGTTWRPNP